MMKSGLWFALLLLTFVLFVVACGDDADAPDGDDLDGDIDSAEIESAGESDGDVEDTETPGENGEESDGDIDVSDTESEETQTDALAPEAGFIKIEPISYYFEKGKSREDHGVRAWSGHRGPCRHSCRTLAGR